MSAVGTLPLVSAEWAAARMAAGDVRLIHVSLDAKGYDEGHIAGAIFSDLHADLAKAGTRAETGATKRQYIVPTIGETGEALSNWGALPREHIVFYDDEGQNRWAIRGYWLLRLYGFPLDLVHVLDGGLKAWVGGGGATTTDKSKPERTDGGALLAGLDATLIATADEVLTWSREASATHGPTRILDVRLIDEYLGTDVRAARGGRVPGARHRLFSDFTNAAGGLRPAGEALAVLRASGVEPSELRAVYCQGGVRAALAWFELHEIAGLTEVRNYAESWEEWGNRQDLPVEK